MVPTGCWFCPFGRIARDPEGLLRRVEAFLGLPPAPYKGLHKKVFASPDGFAVPPEARAALRDKLQPQFDFLEAAMDADFLADMR